MTYSKNERAEKAVGIRNISPNTIIFDFPCELGYFCPVCREDKDVSLQWSEYNGFIWCPRCDRDFPSAICTDNIDRAIEIYLTCVEDAKGIEKPEKPRLLNIDQETVLSEMWSDGEYCTNYRILSNSTKFSRSYLETIIKKLKENDMIEYHRGLMTDEGQVAGSGWCRSKKGNEYMEEHEL